jgi:hypothetical protein
LYPTPRISSQPLAARLQSADALAPGAPADSAQKVYRYDVATDTVTYLPGVSGTIVTSSDDGSRFLFGDNAHIAVWDRGAIKTLYTGSTNQIAPARATASGSVFVFSTDASIGGANTGGSVQIYRYDVAADRATCLSCTADGTPGTATLAIQNNPSRTVALGENIPARGMSADGRRVFFQTPTALVSRDTNGKIDVYEWTPNGASLISSGRSQDGSLLLDISASGDDVFFATAEGLSADDTDGAYDVYDARVGGGFKKDGATAPCIGDACQGAVFGPPSLPVPGSARFSGAGNQPVGEAVATTKKALTCKKGYVKKSVRGKQACVKTPKAKKKATKKKSVKKRATKRSAKS